RGEVPVVPEPRERPAHRRAYVAAGTPRRGQGDPDELREQPTDAYRSAARRAGGHEFRVGAEAAARRVDRGPFGLDPRACVLQYPRVGDDEPGRGAPHAPLGGAFPDRQRLDQRHRGHDPPDEAWWLPSPPPPKIGGRSDVELSSPVDVPSSLD